MSDADNVARLREVKRLLDRIQQLPHIASAGNGLANGGYAGTLSTLDEPPPPLYAGRPASPVLPSPVLPSPVLYRGEHRGEASRALVPVQPSSSVGINPWLFVTATAVNTVIAAVLAVVITLGVARREPAPGEADQAPRGKLGAHAAALWKDRAEPASVRPVELMPVGSPSEPLRLEAMKPSRLPLQVRPEEALQESYILVLSGLPANATLSGATRMGSDSWLLAPGALKQLEIIVPEWSVSVIEVGVELRRANGAVAAQSRAWLTVPPPGPHGGKLDQAAIKDLLQSGDRLLGRGDVASARAIYERAAAMGSAQAALALGSTYDPGRLWALGVFGMVGNKERARHWYQRADQLGHPEAKDRLKALRID